MHRPQVALIVIIIACMPASSSLWARDFVEECKQNSRDPIFQKALAEIPAGKLCVTDAQLALESDVGKRTVASAAWWGFTPENSHTALQRAFRSKASIVIVPNIDGKPWKVHTAINVERDDITILLQGGVVIHATHIPGNAGRWKYRYTPSLNLLDARNQRGITIRGEKDAATRPKLCIQNEVFPKDSNPGTRRFHTGSQPNQYGSPFRMALKFIGCERISIIGLDVGSFGGDGIYVRNCANVLVQDVICNENMRNGMSLISGSNVTIADSRFLQPSGQERASPGSGIDIEPNGNQRIVNCRIVRCEITGNRFRGLWINLNKFSPSFQPADILISECTIGCVTKKWTFGITHLRRKDRVEIQRTKVESFFCELPTATVHLDPRDGPTVTFNGSIQNGLCSISIAGE